MQTILLPVAWRNELEPLDSDPMHFRIFIALFSLLVAPFRARASDKIDLPMPKLMLGAIKLEPHFLSMPGFGIRFSLKF